MLLLAILLTLLGAAILVAIVRGHRQLAGALTRSEAAPPPPSKYPSVTLVRPMRGLDVGARENILALLDTSYPGALEILFVFDAESDPGWPLVRELIQQRPRTPPDRIDVLFAGSPPPGRTGKLNAMILAARQAEGELLAFGDSDTRPDPHLLRQLVEALEADPKAGASFAPIVAAADAPTAGDVGYGLLVNAWYGPSVELAAGRHREFPFIMGQLMVFRRQALDAIGGLQCAEGQFVDDMYIGQCVARAGWRNVVTTHRLRVVTGEMTMPQFLRTFRRWVLFSEGGLPSDFTRPNWVRGVLAWLAWLALAASLAIRSPAATLLSAAALCAVVASQVSLQRLFGGPKIAVRHLWVPAVLPLLAGAVALSTRVYRRVDWRGRSYNLDRATRLDRATSPRLEDSAKRS